MSLKNGKWEQCQTDSSCLLLFRSLSDSIGEELGKDVKGKIKRKSRENEFFVYYVFDDSKSGKSPKIIISLNNGNLKVDLIDNYKNWTYDLFEILGEKLKEFNDNKYLLEVEKLKKLLPIRDKNNNKVELTKEELRFLYEVDEDVNDVNYFKSPIIYEILDTRIIKEDLAKVLECQERLIQVTEFNVENYKYEPQIGLSYIYSLTNVDLSNFRNENLRFSNLNSLTNVKFKETLNGNLKMSNLEKLKNVTFPTSMKGNIELHSLEEVQDLKLPENLKGKIYLSSLRQIDELILPKVLNGQVAMSLFLKTNKLVLPEVMSGQIIIPNEENIKEIEISNDLIYDPNSLIFMGGNIYIGSDILKKERLINNKVLNLKK